MLDPVLNEQEAIIENEIGHQEAIEAIRELRGVKFDAAIVDLFLRIIAHTD